MRLFARRALTCLLIAALMPASVGIVVIPAPVHRTSSAGLAQASAGFPFPCQEHGCGCTCDTCRTHCCCHPNDSAQPGPAEPGNDQGADDGNPLLVEIRSASCAGGEHELACVSADWQTAPASAPGWIFPLVCTLGAPDAAHRDSPTLPIDPPPPRA